MIKCCYDRFVRIGFVFIRVMLNAYQNFWINTTRVFATGLRYWLSFFCLVCLHGLSSWLAGWFLLEANIPRLDMFGALSILEARL